MNTVDVLPQWAGFIATGGRINVAAAIANPTVCTYSLSEKAISFPVDGGSGAFNVNSATNCGFDAFSDQAWVRVTSGAGITSGSVEYTVLPNPSLEPRTATLTVAGKLYTITQYGAGIPLATASVSGRVLSPDGKGINKAVVTITDGAGFTRQALTGPTGSYRFDGVPNARSYTMTASVKRYTFDARSIILVGNAENVDFTGVRE